MATLSLSQKSVLFTVYNKARACGLDRPRVNRAMGLVQAGKVRKVNAATFAVEGDGCTYMVINGKCSCKDAQYRPAEKCKHLVATWIVQRMEQASQDATPAPAPIVNEQELEDEISKLWGAA